MVTTARAFEDEVRAHLALVKIREIVPEILDVNSMRRRYVVQAMSVEEDEDGRPRRLTFKDGSVAEYDVVDRRIWREVTDA